MALERYVHWIETKPKEALSQLLLKDKCIIFNSQYLLCSLNLKQKVLILTVFFVCFIVAYLFANQSVSTSVIVAISLVVFSYIYFCFKHKELSQITSCEAEYIRFPDSFVKGKSNNSILLANINKVYVNRFYYHFRYYKGDKLTKSVYKLPIITQVKLKTSNADTIKVPLLNMRELASFVTYLELHNVTLTYRYPTSFKLIGISFLVLLICKVVFQHSVIF